MEPAGGVRPTPRQDELVDRLAAKVVERKMSLPAILFLETVRPLNFVGSQVLVFLGPVVKALFTARDYDEIQEFLEHREGIERLVRRIEEKEAAAGNPRRAAEGPPG